MRRLAVVVPLLMLLTAGTGACSWLVGVSGDPEVVDGTGSDDAGDEGASADASVE